MKRSQDTHPTIRLEDYRQPDFWIDAVELTVSLGEDGTEVTARLSARRNERAAPDAPLVLDGRELELVSVAIDGEQLSPAQYTLTETHLTVPTVLARLTLETRCVIHPEKNTALEGLYVSKGMFLTQCEAEGFRRITFYPDRPDVMARFRTTLEADRERFPLLLSNGNPVAREELPNGRHRVTWEDPFKKPCYLFAMVAGELACREDFFTTCSGRRVKLQFFTEARDLDKVEHALESLKRAMRWDEEKYGREYDLDLFMVVAVRHFNMGAMENKGLNIFNSSCVLASGRTQTDAAFQRVERVVAHEYFHNWSGNRVTCRDWFQLSLKEGFTVLRDSEFGADMGSAAVVRIASASALRSVQFPEDAGPLAHPVRPDSYVEIDNFYTTTVYEKGAEVVRMLRTLLGSEAFRRGTDLYFARHDGEAVTTDDFVRCMEEVGRVDLTQFKRWYSQAGTPRLRARGVFDAAAETYTLTFEQSCPPTPGQPTKEPFVLPVAVGLVDEAGRDLALSARELPGKTGTTLVIPLTHPSESVTFTGVRARPIPSILRGFSAPVLLDAGHTDDELALLATHDSDAYNRWAASQELSTRKLIALADALSAEALDEALALDERWVGTFIEALGERALDPALRAELLRLPDESQLADRLGESEPEVLHRARELTRRALARRLGRELQALAELPSEAEPFAATMSQVAERSLRNACLSLVAADPSDAVSALLARRLTAATNMTDRLAALTALVHSGRDGEAALADFHREFESEGLVTDAWFALQATNPTGDAIARAERLVAHPDYDPLLPNRVRAVVAGLCRGNPAAFHRADGAGYRFLAATVGALDERNPQLAASLAGLFSRFRLAPRARHPLARAAMHELLARAKVSANLYEVLTKTLAV